MSGPVKRWDPVINGAAMRQTSTGAYALFSDYEAVVRELAEAREKLESVTVVKDGMIRVSKELSDEVERLRALLDEAPHAQDCDYLLDVSMEYTLPYNCYKARLPREGG